MGRSLATQLLIRTRVRGEGGGGQHLLIAAIERIGDRAAVR